MSEPFLAEIRIVSFNYAPKAWAQCNGQFLPINQNQALFSLLGTTFGGNGQTTFALPDLRGRTPIHVGSGHTLGEKGGEISHTVTTAEMPAHVHFVNGTSAVGDAVIPNGALLGRDAPTNRYLAPETLATMNPATITSTGGSQAHENMQPYLTLNCCIALQGIFPSRT